MEDAINAMTEAGYGDALIAAAPLIDTRTFVKFCEEAGTFTDYVERYDEEEDEYYDDPVSIEHEAGAIICRNGSGEMEVLKVADFTETVREPVAEGDYAIGETVYVLGPQRVCSIDDEGQVVGFNPETGAIERTDVGQIVFFDRDGGVALNGGYMDIRAQFEELMKKVDTLPFHPQGFFQRFYDKRIEISEPHERSRLYFLHNSLQLAAGVELEVPDFGDARVSEECWEQALASVPEDLREHAEGAMQLEGMFPGADTTMGQRIRAIFAALAPMPVDDFRGSFKSIGQELADQRDPVTQSRFEYMEELVANGGREIDISFELAQAVAGLYGECQMKIVETGEMRTLLVLDHASANMYFYPANPELTQEHDNAPAM